LAENKVNTAPALILIGGSAGSLDVLLYLLPRLQRSPLPAIVIVTHRKVSSDSTLADLLNARTKYKVKEVDEKEQIQPDTIYIAPADYHLLFEKDRTFSLDYSEKVNYCRPSIDVSFQSAAEVYGDRLLCILLSGANQDGSEGLVRAKELGGLTAVQDPASAITAYMPQYAVSNAIPDLVLNLDDIVNLCNGTSLSGG
jgi:two-component system chemotaxis response regulator CheB